jgi:hypothetical protein
MDARRNGWDGRSQMAFDIGQISETFGRRNGKIDQMNVIMSNYHAPQLQYVSQ